MTGLLAALLLIVAYVGLVRWIEANSAFFPSREIHTTPAKAGVPFEEVAFPSLDGTRLAGWWMEGETGLPAVVWCHGNAGNISDRVHLAAELHRRGVPILLFDYRGYGRSEGTPDEQGVVEDAASAVAWLRARFPGRPVVLLGRSLGAGAASNAAVLLQDQGRPPEALILLSPFVSVPAMARAVYPYLPAGPILRYRFDNAAAVRSWRGPLLVIAAPADEVVPFAQSRAVFDASASSGKQKVEVRGGHNDCELLDPETFYGAIETSLRQHATKPL